jgi:hypothetical protein
MENTAGTNIYFPYTKENLIKIKFQLLIQHYGFSILKSPHISAKGQQMSQDLTISFLIGHFHQTTIHSFLFLRGISAASPNTGRVMHYKAEVHEGGGGVMLKMPVKLAQGLMIPQPTISSKRHGFFATSVSAVAS